MSEAQQEAPPATTFLGLPIELQSLIATHASSHTKSMLLAASHATRRAVLAADQLDLKLTLGPGSSAHLPTVVKLLEVSSESTHAVHASTAATSGQDQGAVPSASSGVQRNTPASGSSLTLALSAADRSGGQAAGPLSMPAESAPAAATSFTVVAPAAATAAGSPARSPQAARRERVCSLTLPLVQTCPPLVPMSMEAYLPSIQMLTSVSVTNLTLKGPGSLGASGSIAALRYLRELVLDNVVLHAQWLSELSQAATGLTSLVLSAITFDPVNASKTACLALKPPGFPALRQLELRGVPPQGISLLAPEAAARVTHLTLNVPSPLPSTQHDSQYAAAAALILRAVDACPGLQTLEIDGTAAWDCMEFNITPHAWQFNASPERNSYMIEIFPRVAANAVQPGDRGAIVGTRLLEIAINYFNVMSILDGDGQGAAGASAGVQPKHQVTMTNVPGRLAQHLGFVRNGLTELRAQDAGVLRTWVFHAASLQLLADIDAQHHDPNWSDSLRDFVMPVLRKVVTKDLRQQGFHTLRSVQLAATLDYVQFSALSFLPCLATVKLGGIDAPGWAKPRDDHVGSSLELLCIEELHVEWAWKFCWLTKVPRVEISTLTFSHKAFETERRQANEEGDDEEEGEEEEEGNADAPVHADGHKPYTARITGLVNLLSQVTDLRMTTKSGQPCLDLHLPGHGSSHADHPCSPHTEVVSELAPLLNGRTESLGVHLHDLPADEGGDHSALWLGLLRELPGLSELHITYRVHQGPDDSRTLAGYQALADECALRCRRLWLTLDARQLSKASRAQLEARSKGWLQLRVASLAEDEGHISDEDAGHEDAAMV